MLLEKYPGDFTAEEAAWLGVGLFTVGAGPIVIEAGAGAVAAAWPALTAAGGAACADGDCTNEASAVVRGASSAVRGLQRLPRLSGTIADAFKNGEYVERTLKPGELLYRAEAAAASAPGRWFGTQLTQSAARAERWWNVAKWGNPLEVVRTYEVTQEMTVYYGAVAGGNGTQILFPFSVEAGQIGQFVKMVAEHTLR
jgi:hypothetical protein